MTILGKHSLEETRELLKEKASEIAQLNGGIKAHAKEIKRKDPSFAGEWDKFFSDWQRFASSLSAVLALKSKTTPLPDSATDAETEYQLILTQLQKTPGHFERGDLADFVDRLAKMEVDITVVVNQPESVDLDLEGFKQSDSAIRGFEAYAPFAIGAGLGVVALLWYLDRRR